MTTIVDQWMRDILNVLTEHLAAEPEQPREHAEARVCLSCGAKTDPYGNLPCGH